MGVQATGLDYAVVFRLLDNLQLTPDAWNDLFDDVQVMEESALLVINK